MARKNKQLYSCDFETTTDPNDCRVWAYGWMEIGNLENYEIGNNIEDFMQWVESCNGILYFHNLRFDGEFIVNWLLHNGYTHSDSGKAKTFTATISEMGQWYILDICFGYKGNDKIHTVIYDSLKKLPFPVKNIAKDFGLPLLKGDIDYHTFRPVGHEITEEEYAYIKNDIEIIARALEIQLSQGLKQMTNGSDSLKGFKTSISDKAFKRLFPVLTKETDDQIRKAYRGGWTYLKPEYASVPVGHGVVYDVNSLYPAQMYTRPLPYGTPKYFNGKYEQDNDFPLYIQVIQCDFELKEGYLPTIQLKSGGVFAQNEYLTSSEGECPELFLSNVDLELFFEHYEVYNVTYKNGYKFRSKTGLFNKFIDYWTYIKITEKGAKKLLAKLMLNSLYGKFATNPDITGKIPFLKEDGSTGLTLPYKMYEDGSYMLNEKGKRIVDREFKNPVYTAMGVFITSWARYTTITTGQKMFDRFIYADTDSLHLIGTETAEAIKDIIDPNKLGYWDHESTFVRAKFIRQKTYVEDVCKKYERDNEGIIKMKDGKKVIIGAGIEDMEFTYLSVKCAGMPERIKEKVTFDNFEVGFESNGKLMPKHVYGGVVLVDSTFKIK